jgi:hypothetical protein
MNLEFKDLDEIQFKQLSKASDMAACLFDIRMNFYKELIKWSVPPLTGEEVLQKVFDKMDEYDINVEDLN